MPFPPGSRPIPQGPPPSFGPLRPNPSIPPRRGFNPQYNPQFKPPGSYFTQQSGSSFTSSGSSFANKPLGPLFSPDGPIEVSEPYPFETSNGGLKKPVVVIQGGTGVNKVQEHVHHHFHHAEGTGGVKVPVATIPVHTAAVSSATTGGITGASFVGGSSSNFVGGSGSNFGGSSGSSFVGGTGGFSPVNSGFGGFKETQTSAIYGGLGTYASNVKPVVENYGPQSFDNTASPSFSNTGSFGNSGTYGSGQYASSTNFGANTIGASVGQYGSSTSPFYKKELNLNSQLNGNSIQNYGGSYANQFQQFQSGNAQNYDCVCVPYDQCPAQHVIGRKDDLYLPLDPRSLKTDIVAEDVVITDGNGTMTIVRIPKNATVENITAEKKITKREAVEEKKEEGKDKAKVEPVSI